MNKDLQQLNPLPIIFDKESHRYIWKPTGEVFTHSVTGITGFNMDEKKKLAIERTKKYWAPRGTTVHSAFEHWLNHEEYGENEIKKWEKYRDWIEPLLDHQYLVNDFKAIATEFTVCDRKNGIAGTFDAFGFDQRTEKYVLVDLKTQSNKNANAYNTDEQLGAYASMLIEMGVWIDECRTIWCRPEKTVVGEYQDVSTCLEAWHSKLGYWKMMQEEF
jgi:hypothetical protein|tara:strand:- start:12 stop:662 length:651 start_codon:yes stop_codon:yes gene_type:complete